MSYSLDWDEKALDTAAGYLSDDPAGLEALFDVLDQLTEDPRPQGTTVLEFGTLDLRRIGVGRYRALYQIFESVHTIVVIHLGRVG